MRPPPAALSLVAAVLAAPLVSAQPRPPARPPARPGATAPARPGVPARPGAPAVAGQGAAARVIPLRDAVQMLQSANGDDVLTGLEALVRIGSAEVVPPMVELIHRGLADDTLEGVVEKLGIIARPEAIDELSSLLHHRRPAVRERAVVALSHIRDNRVRPLLESGLRDSESSVRGAAARALGEVGARQSVELLQRAFERNVPEAAESLGRLGDVAVANRLLESVGHVSLSVLLPGFRRVLDRRDIPDTEKLRIIEQLVSRSPTVEVKRWLQAWVDSGPPTPDRTRARQRAMLAIRQIHDDAPATPSTPPAAPTPPAAATPAGGAR